ncbi:MAG: VOC family protein [Thermomicrobiales bacterium]
MAIVSTYLTFNGQTDAAFTFYKGVFGTEYIGEPARYGQMPVGEGDDPIPAEIANLIMNVQLPILGGHLLMGSDAHPMYSPGLVMGNNISPTLHPDSREEADTLYSALSEGGEARMPMADQFWGDYYGELTDPFGILWNIVYSPAS